MTKVNENFELEKALFREHILSLGLRRTNQREMILEIFLSTEEHLTVDDLHWLVHKQDATIGHTTVYRTLKLLTEAGLAREVRFGDNKTYFEHHFNHEHHDHMICTNCGKVIEFFSAEIEAVQDEVAEKLSFKPTHHSLRLWGSCEDCHGISSITPQAPAGAQPKVRVRSSGGY